MASSPYISNEVKQYMRKFEIEKLINSSVNELLKKKPQDPYGYLIGIFQKLASSDIQIKNIKAYEVITGQGFPAIKLSVKIQYLNKQMQIIINQSFGILSDEFIQYDNDRMNGKGMNKSINFINQIVVNKIIGYKCGNQYEIDKILQSILQQKGINNLYCINNISYCIPKIQSQILAKPLYSIISDIAQIKHQKNNTHTNMNIVVNCLQGGKAIGSKCKVFKYTIISKDSCKDPYLAQNILAGVRKSIVGGKGGQAALKFAPDGTFVCPLDTIMDNLKIVEEAINAANAKEYFGVGLSWAADTLFSADTKKYQLQNPKTPFDNDQMIDFLIKLVTDKPIITYLEDPLAASQLAAWKKLKTKLQNTQALKHVKIGTRNQKLIPAAASPFSQQHIKNALNNLSIPVTADSNPELTQQQRTHSNANKFNLDYYHIRLFELKTLSNVIKLSKILSKTNTKLILQDNLYQTYDTSIIDLCHGIGALANLGSINGNKYDRISKLARVKEIKDSQILKEDGK